jgi:hypothetical protein
MVTGFYQLQIDLAGDLVGFGLFDYSAQKQR